MPVGAERCDNWLTGGYPANRKLSLMMGPLSATALQRRSNTFLRVRELANAAAGAYRHSLAVTRQRPRRTRIAEPASWMRLTVRPRSTAGIGRSAAAPDEANVGATTGKAWMRRSVPGRVSGSSLPTNLRNLTNKASVSNTTGASPLLSPRHRIVKPYWVRQGQPLETGRPSPTLAPSYVRKLQEVKRVTSSVLRPWFRLALRNAGTRPRHLAVLSSAAETMPRSMPMAAPRRPVVPISTLQDEKLDAPTRTWPHRVAWHSQARQSSYASDRPAADPPRSPHTGQPDLEEADLGQQMLDYLERQMLRPRRGMTGVDPKVMPF